MSKVDYPNCPDCGRLIDATETMVVERDGPAGFSWGCKDCMTSKRTVLSDF